MQELTKKELYEAARELDIEGRAAMDKQELEQAVREAGGLDSAGASSTQPPPQRPTGKWIHDHLLSITLFSLFLVSLIGQYYFQYQHEVDQAIQHGESAPAATSSDFLNAFFASVLENWQSEFLQLVSFVVLATYLIHRGSPQSRDSDDEMAADIKAIKEKLGA